ncbi:hypothetical protein AB7533_23685 [Providencia rettgeri]
MKRHDKILHYRGLN